MYQFVQSQTNSNQFSALDFLGSVVALSPTITWILFAVLLIITAVISFVLSYHWRRYTFDTSALAQTSLVYYVVTALLLVIIAVSLAIYLNSL